MKHLFIHIFLLLLLPMLCVAQDDAGERERRVFKGSLVLGMNMCQVDGDSYAGYSKVGLHAGGLVNIRIDKIWSVSMELLYSQKGVRGAHVQESYYVGTYFDKYFLNLNYVEVPAVVHFKKWDYYGLEAGFSYAQLVHTEEWGEADVPVWIDPVLNHFNTSDVCFLFGGTAQLNRNWMAEARFEYSITDIRPWERVPPRYNMNVGQRNNVVTLRLVRVF